ncbi:MAG: helix-turn-helix transcriptional regulator [Methylophilaceae bacterium]|nr:MAG: helix-turn-helix transcriptional regulator [Methylophilaceae bacterium]
MLTGAASNDRFNNGRLNEYHAADTQTTYPNYLLITQYKPPNTAAENSADLLQNKMIINVLINAIDWRNKTDANASKLKVVTVYGDSMSPTLNHGDQVILDTSCNKFIDDAIYAIQQGVSLRIKRIKLHLNGSIEVKSDNNHGFSAEKYTAGEAKNLNIVCKVLPYKFGQFEC